MRIKFMKYNLIRLDYELIVKLIGYGSSVLDLGCGDGELLSLLVREKKVKGEGIEIDEQMIYKCVSKGLSVSHQDINRDGLTSYGDDAFDYVLLSNTLQQVRNPDEVLAEALRVGKRVILVFPNFAYYKARFQIFFTGKVPITPSLPYEWYNTPNLHFLSILDFIDYCSKRGINTEKSLFIRKNKLAKFAPNIFAQSGIFLISKNIKNPKKPDQTNTGDDPDTIPWYIF